MEILSVLDWREGLAVLFGLLYVILAARNVVWCWFWGILSCLLWAWVAFDLYDLYIDALLQLFYVGISIWGIYSWLYGGQSSEELPVSRMKSKSHYLIIGLGLPGSLLLGYFFGEYTDAAATYPDAFTTLFSIITTILVIKRKLENWLYWIVIDTVYIFLYASRGSILFTLLFVLYLVIAVFGYFKWKREMGEWENRGIG